MEREKIPVRQKFEDFIPEWRPFAREESPGLFYLAARTSGPKLEFWALRADLTEASLKIVVNAPDGETGKMPGTKVSSFVRDYGLLAGINAVPFDPVSAMEGEERTCAGIVVSGGVLAAPPVADYDAIVFYKTENAKDRRAAIVPGNRERRP